MIELKSSQWTNEKRKRDGTNERERPLIATKHCEIQKKKKKKKQTWR